MSILRRAFASKEVRGVLGVLDELSLRHDNEAFGRVHSLVEKMVLSRQRELTSLVRNGKPARSFVLGVVVNISYDLLQTGNYNIYHGVLNPHDIGPDLLTIHDDAVGEAERLGYLDHADAEERKSEVRARIAEVG